MNSSAERLSPLAVTRPLAIKRPNRQSLGFFPRQTQVLPNGLYFPYMKNISICIRFSVFRSVSMSFAILET